MPLAWRRPLAALKYSTGPTDSLGFKSPLACIDLPTRTSFTVYCTETLARACAPVLGGPVPQVDGEPSHFQKEKHFFDSPQRYGQGMDFYHSHFTDWPPPAGTLIDYVHSRSFYYIITIVEPLSPPTSTSAQSPHEYPMSLISSSTGRRGFSPPPNTHL